MRLDQEKRKFAGKLFPFNTCLSGNRNLFLNLISFYELN